ncbi:HAD family hydrolase [Actinokineospora iranica]|uniref:Haloacid dehalogenase superfamily, subfamily IA, variant 3 with third motif having DD or ED n=1 Tax=Actinokineospora iranica TaxID=1271860 RepID=A0A1G6SYZ0_9PSEU|nr:HAD-IA family hydrolase [Actinokineospora iranica]SDD21834.1 haloacid dehalogenase superfamily, subfamily IA, variant 3 with third motif having DD or ED [Actinokineospora iranica]
MRYEALVVDYAGVFTEPVIRHVVALVRGQGFRTALLSNADTVPGGLPDVFDAVVVSGEVGIAKPAAGVFTLTAERLGTTTDKCVFVDDVAAYVRGAAAAGMTGVHHRAVETTVDELEILLGVSLR